MTSAVRPAAYLQNLVDGAGQNFAAARYGRQFGCDATHLGFLVRIQAHEESLTGQIHKHLDYIVYIYTMPKGSGVRSTAGPSHSPVADFISRYRPTALDPAAADLVREVVALSSPGSIDRAKTLLWSAGQAVKFACSSGLQLKAEVLFHPSTVERLIQTATGHMSGPARRTLRTNLRHLGARVAPAEYPVVAALSRERAKTPYTPAEIAGYLALADAQPTASRAMRASALICLGAGGGIVGRELAFVRGFDIVGRFGGVVVQVSGPRARSVPVLPVFHDRLLATAKFAADGYVIGGADPARRNVTYDLVSSLCGGIDLPRLDTGRLRATWLAAVADLIGLPTFMAAAGIVCSQRLGDIIAGLDPGGVAEAVALLGASS